MANDSISMKCEHCSANLKLPGTLAPGKKIKCPKCSGVIIVPSATAPSKPPKDEKKPLKLRLKKRIVAMMMMTMACFMDCEILPNLGKRRNRNPR